MKYVLCGLITLGTSLYAISPLDLLQITPSAQSISYVEQQKQFQLHSLITEQRHSKTWDLSHVLKKNTLEGIALLLSVDEDIAKTFRLMSTENLEQAAQSIVDAIKEGNRIYVYGCGATGRLAKLIESAFWRPFCLQLTTLPQWEKISNDMPHLSERLIGEMTGGDRALISSLEGLEDLLLIGELQLQEHGITEKDVVFAITEGGETSSVIGTILSALALSSPDPIKTNKKLYFLYNNPEECLLPFDRSRLVLENRGITKICLCTGPQAITGSTRMQATTSETFVMGVILEHAICQLLNPYFSSTELQALGLDPTLLLKDRLLSFIDVQQTVQAAAPQIARLTDKEADTYARGGKSTYMAHKGILTIFTDATERAPTFRLPPLDPIGQARKSWIQVLTPTKTPAQAWLQLLGRPFRGLEKEFYFLPFSSRIDSAFLQSAALSSLEKAGKDQQNLYDFSLSADTIVERSPTEEDIGILALIAEEKAEDFASYLDFFAPHRIGIFTTAKKHLLPEACIIHLPIASEKDPLGVRQHIALKMALNAHSSAVMGKLGKIVGNTMTSVHPGNLKLIGRATHMIFLHVNHVFPYLISYQEANAALFAAIDFVKQQNGTQPNAEVPLCIVRFLESQHRQTFVSWEEAQKILQTKDLENYINEMLSIVQPPIPKSG